MSPMERSEALDARDPLAAVRQRFVLPSGVVYLDGNSLGALPVGVAARVAAVVREQWGEGLIRSWNDADWYDLPTRVGDRIAPLVGAQPGEIVVGDSTSVSLFRVVAAALSLRPDRRVIVTEAGNFPTDLYILEGIRQLRPDLEIRAVERDVDPSSALDGAAVLVLTHVDYKTGLVRDMKRLSTAAHEAGALAVWDLSHSTGVLELDVHGEGADFAVGCGYKYLNGGPGAPSFTWAAPSIASAAQQPLSGWFGHRDPFAFDAAYAPAPGIRRFITGTQQVLSLVALDEALKAWEGVSMREVREKSMAQTSRFLERDAHVFHEVFDEEARIEIALQHARREMVECPAGGGAAPDRLEHAGEMQPRPVPIQQALADADHRAGIVEHVDQEEAEHDDNEGLFRDARKIEFEQRRLDRRWRRNDAAILREPERQADQRHDENSDHGAADHLAEV